MSTTAADSHDQIRVHGARVNNLKNIDITLPKRRLSVFTGVSGSGKSSLVFGTIGAESQRMINETYSAFVQGFMPALDRPDVDSLDGLTTAIIVDQERMGANVRSTLGTVTDVNALLRVLFSRLGSPHVGSPNAYSFNMPTVQGQGAITISKGAGKGTKQVKRFHQLGGMCPRCEGMGTVNDLDLAQLYNAELSLAEGALTIPGYTAGGWNYRMYAESGFIDPDKKLKDYSEQELADFLHHEPLRMKIAGINMTYEGLIPRIQRSMLSKGVESMQPHIRVFVERAVAFQPCPDCHGTRLAEHARTSCIKGLSIADVCALQLDEVSAWLAGITDPGVAPLVANLQRTIDAFIAIGLGYLSLDRPSGTLSGGEAQRTKLVRHLGSSLTDVTYIFDEPSIGLHPHDIGTMNQLLLQLRDKGNTVLVVEHKPDVIAIADHVVELGPTAGSGGGQICFEGSVEQLRASDTMTGRHLNDHAQLKPKVRTHQGYIEIRHANTHNLNDVSVDIPRGVLTVVTGVAGSGKSSLIHGSMPAAAGAIVINQAPIKTNRRSNPATFTSMLDPIRKAFAGANDVKPGLFSANSEGACPTCNGSGVVETELGFMNTVANVCQECDGSGFHAEVLDYRLGELNIAEVMALPVAEARDFFASPPSKVPAAVKVLDRLIDVGLAYLRLGQPLTTLSGGERQRLKLAAQLADKGDVYVLDEPTTGLHLADVERLLALLDRLVDAGKTVIVIEHHQAVMAHADWLIDVGPGAGHHGGQVVFTGIPADLVASKATVTGEHLAAYVTGN